MSPPVPVTVTVPDRESAAQVMALVSTLHARERKLECEQHGVREQVRYGASTLTDDVRQWLRMVSIDARREARVVAEIHHESGQNIVSDRDVRARLGPPVLEAADSRRAAAASGYPAPSDAERSLHWIDHRVAEALLNLIDPWITALEPLLLQGAESRG